MFYIKPCEDVLFSAILTSLSTARSSAKLLNLANNTANSFKWATDGQLARMDLSNLQTLVFHPTVEGSCIGQDDKIFHSSKALRTILKRCAQSIEYSSIGATCPVYWPQPSRSTPVLPR